MSGWTTEQWLALGALVVFAVLVNAFMPLIRQQKKGSAPFYLYSREGCHLCEQAEQAFRQRFPALALEVRDVDERLEWHQRWDEKVPVLQAPNGDVLEAAVDPATLLNFVRAHVR